MARYRVRLRKGQIVGPLELSEIKELITKKEIQGDEQACAEDDGRWRSIVKFPPLAKLLINAAAGTEVSIFKTSTSRLDPTVPIEMTEFSIKPKESTSEQSKTEIAQESLSNEDKTVIDATTVKTKRALSPSISAHSEEKTVLINREEKIKKQERPKPHHRPKNKKIYRLALVGGLGALVAVSLLIDLKQPTQKATGLYRVTLPSITSRSNEPKKSKDLYQASIKHYLTDTSQGYRKAAELLRQSISLDPTNAEALGMLAVTYLNLIEESVQDEVYFEVVNKIIELGKANQVDVTALVMADIEWLLVRAKPEAAKERLVQFSKANQYGPELFYYLGIVYFQQANYKAAVDALSQIDNAQTFSPKVFAIKGQVAEAMGYDDEALGFYQKAIVTEPAHSKSIVARLSLLSKLGRWDEMKADLKLGLKNEADMSMRLRAQFFFEYSKFLAYKKSWEESLQEALKAIALNPEKHEYLLHYYTVRVESGGVKASDVRGKARMYYFLAEGEKKLNQFLYDQARDFFLQARESDVDSALPLVRLGDVFYKMKNFESSKINYQKAIDKGHDTLSVVSKLAKVLIESYEWQEAIAAIDRLRNRPGTDGLVARLLGDLYASQNLPVDAIVHFRKALSYESSNEDLYLSLAKNLMRVKRFEEALVYLGLGRRMDPYNNELSSLFAECISEIESIDRAIAFLDNVLKAEKISPYPIELSLAELELKRGHYLEAESKAKAILAKNDFAPVYRFLGKLYWSKEDDKKSLQKALQALKSYSDRSPADPQPYLDRYEIYIKLSKWDKAMEEIDRIYTIFPKYPAVHFYRGSLYSLMGNTQAAIAEFETELKNNPKQLDALMGYGRELLKQEDYIGALDKYNAAMKAAPGASEPKHMAGFTNYLLKNYEGAIALLKAAIEIDPGNPLIYKRLGAAQRALGDVAGAKNAFIKYLQLAPDAPDAAEIKGFMEP